MLVSPGLFSSLPVRLRALQRLPPLARGVDRGVVAVRPREVLAPDLARGRVPDADDVDAELRRGPLVVVRLEVGGRDDAGPGRQEDAIALRVAWSCTSSANFGEIRVAAVGCRATRDKPLTATSL